MGGNTRGAFASIPHDCCKRERAAREFTLPSESSYQNPTGEGNGCLGQIRQIFIVPAVSADLPVVRILKARCRKSTSPDQFKKKNFSVSATSLGSRCRNSSRHFRPAMTCGGTSFPTFGTSLVLAIMYLMIAFLVDAS